MAIDTGLAIVCADLQATGGIKRILIRAWTDDDVVLYGTTPATHTITSIKDLAADAAWGVYEFKNETPALTISATKEMGSTAFECGLSFFLPKLEYLKFNLIESITSSCLMVIAVDTNDNAFVLGASEKYENEATGKQSRSQTFAQLATVEGGTGAAYSDESGITISLMARQFEMPRQYVVASPSLGIVVAADGLTATTD